MYNNGDFPAKLQQLATLFLLRIIAIFRPSLTHQKRSTWQVSKLPFLPWMTLVDFFENCVDEVPESCCLLLVIDHGGSFFLYSSWTNSRSRIIWLLTTRWGKDCRVQRGGLSNLQTTIFFIKLDSTITQRCWNDSLAKNVIQRKNCK